MLEPSDPGFAELRAALPEHPGIRCLVRVEVTRVSDSCGFGVPRMAFEGERTQLRDWAERKGPAGLREYPAAHNRSVDGLPGLREES